MRISSTGSAPSTLLDHLLRIGPGAVAVRVVRLEQDVLDADAMARRRSSRHPRSCVNQKLRFSTSLGEFCLSGQFAP
jgi:hypothetical protein